MTNYEIRVRIEEVEKEIASLKASNDPDKESKISQLKEELSSLKSQLGGWSR